MNVARGRLIAIAIITASAATMAAAPNPLLDDAKPFRVIQTLALKKVISWGYGCGGHCAFNHKGGSTVTLAFGGNGEVTATDKGSYTFGQSSPAGHREETREWLFAYKGTWAEDGGVRTLDLKLTLSTCATKGGNGPRLTQGSGDTVRPESACPEPNHKMKLTCRPERVAIGGTRGAPDAGFAATEPALVCRPGESTVYFGTTPPWTFGTERSITTRYVGEPHPETLFSIEN